MDIISRSEAKQQETRQRERKYERPWYRDIERKSLKEIKNIVRDIRRKFKNRKR